MVAIVHSFNSTVFVVVVRGVRYDPGVRVRGVAMEVQTPFRLYGFVCSYTSFRDATEVRRFVMSFRDATEVRRFVTQRRCVVS